MPCGLLRSMHENSRAFSQILKEKTMAVVRSFTSFAEDFELRCSGVSSFLSRSSEMAANSDASAR